MDMLHLHQTSKYVGECLENGLSLVRKTKDPFFSIGIDHAHEQNNKSIKEDGGMSAGKIFKDEMVLQSRKYFLVAFCNHHISTAHIFLMVITFGKIFCDFIHLLVCVMCCLSTGFH